MSANDPLDANLESVLPTVHQWHQATNDSIKATNAGLLDLKGEVNELADRIDAGLTKVVNHLDQQREESNRNLASSFVTIAQHLINDSGRRRTSLVPPSKDPQDFMATEVTGNASPTSPISVPENTCSPTTSPPINSEIECDLEEQRSYRMVKRHLSLEDMWCEWHGTGRFADDVGGIKGRNKLFGAKWRKHLEVQHYSRTKCIIDAIKKHSDKNSLRIAETIAVMEAWWKEAPVSMSLTKMKHLCIEKDLLKKGKMRGKQCKKQNTQTTNNDDDSMQTAMDQEV